MEHKQSTLLKFVSRSSEQRSKKKADEATQEEEEETTPKKGSTRSSAGKKAEEIPTKDGGRYYTEEPKFLKVPLDDRGFAVSFTVDQVEESKQFYDKYGMVVYRDVLTIEECRATIEALYRWLEQTRPLFRRNDYSTWENNNWPSGIKYLTSLLSSFCTRSFDPMLVRFGFFSDFPIYHLQESWNNRQNPNVHKAFANIWGREDLWVSFDRFGFMRPTVNIPINGKTATRANWRSDEYFLHLDQNPLIYPDFHRVQGLLNLRDNKEEDGGFQCVPGFHKYFKEWGPRAVKQRRSHLVAIPTDDPQIAAKQHIPMQGGTLLIWDSRLSHGNHPNHSSSPRICQYITMFPNTENNEDFVRKRCEAIATGEVLNSMEIAGHGYSNPRWKRKNFVEPLRPQYHPPVLTELGQCLAGLKKWSGYVPAREDLREEHEEEEGQEKGKEKEADRMALEDTGDLSRKREAAGDDAQGKKKNSMQKHKKQKH